MDFCTTYKEVSKFHGKGSRYYARQIALDILAMSNNLSSNKEHLKKPRIQFLYFHHIFSDELKPFETLVKYLSKEHYFISHSEAVERLLSGKVDKPYISWSSDDGFKNNLDAAKILSKYGASCCFFVNPNSIALNNPSENKRFCNNKLDMPSIEFMDWNDIEFLLKNNHEIGSHTMDHDFVSEMTNDEFISDLLTSKEILEAKCGKIGHFAYPYGKFSFFSEKAHYSVFDSLYDSCSSAVRGCHINSDKKIGKRELLIRRDQVVAAWKLPHMMHFIIKSAKQASFETNYIPENFN